DAEMLARIAAREIESLVQARTEHGAIVVSTMPLAPAEPAPETAAPEAAAEPAAEPQDSPVLVDDTLPEDGVAEAALPEGAETADDVAEVQAEAGAEEPEAIEDAAIGQPEELAEDLQEDFGAAQVEETAEDAPAPAASDDDEDADERAEAELLSEEEEFEPAEPAPATGDIDSIAAKLQRIRAVVSKSRELPEDESFSEDEHADSFLSKTAREIETVLQLDDEMAAAARSEDAADTVAEAPAAPEAPAPELSEDNAGDMPEAAPVVPARARVLRMKKADFEAAVDAGLVEAEAEDSPEAEAEAEPAPAGNVEPAPRRESSLSPAEEAELMAELAQVEAELKADDDEEAAPEEAMAPAAEEAGDRQPRGHHLREAGQQSDADMARLMEAAQSHLDEPDGSRRRQAIAHLRAAVAATKAEQKSGRSTDKPRDVSEPYRDDLASVVNPSAARARAARAGGEPPLKLVAEQRIDTPPAEAARTLVRPRRVSAAEAGERKRPSMEPTAGDHDFASFSEFAESVGAVQLHDVLEAAASYLTFVEGREVFSRPMIVRMARDMEDAGFSREDSLRGFGQLLRENKITKVSGGRFTASEEIGFRPENRAAG
uniref:hypothetical protein n=1 Tax=Shimia sp. TaxID=1954381 RepID=UPI0035699B9A